MIREAGGPILAADRWPTNAALIADVAALGYVTADSYTLDPTYGRGLWWSTFRPTRLVTHDLAIDGVDFRKLPYDTGTFDVVAFDPPYVSVGGRDTSGLPDMLDRYGMADAPTSPAEVQELISGGLTECSRVLKPGGVLLVKCQAYISSGKLWPGDLYTVNHALALGLVLVDRFEHLAGTRPQPPGRRQLHARRNLSTLFVLRKAR